MQPATYERWPVERLVVTSNVRKHFDDESLRQHGESLKQDGQLRALLVLKDGTLVGGERTLRAAKLAGLTHVDVKIVDGDITPSELKKLQLVENLMREDLRDAEVYLACKELIVMHPEWLKKDLMHELHFDPSMATRIFAVDELIPEAKEAFLNGAFGFSKAYAIAKGGTENQQRKLAQVLAGLSREEVEREARKHSDTKAAVKLSRIKIVLADGASVVVSGKTLSMTELVGLLSETLKEARKAAARYDVKTFIAMMKDKAKAG